MRRLILALAIAALEPACATYTGREQSVHADRISVEPGWLRVGPVSWVRQRAAWDCGIAALTSVLKFWSIAGDPEVFSEVLGDALAEQRPIRAGELRAIARAHGASAFLFRATMRDLEEQLEKGRPVLVGELKPTLGGPVAHYAVVIGVHSKTRRVLLLDPALGLRENSFESFDAEWAPTGRLALLVIGSSAVEPSSAPPPSRSIKACVNGCAIAALATTPSM